MLVEIELFAIDEAVLAHTPDQAIRTRRDRKLSPLD
jgi:hypothetical protein